MKHHSLKKRITYNKEIIEKLFNTHTAAIQITTSEDCTDTPGTDTPLSSFKQYFYFFHIVKFAEQNIDNNDIRNHLIHLDNWSLILFSLNNSNIYQMHQNYLKQDLILPFLQTTYED